MKIVVTFKTDPGNKQKKSFPDFDRCFAWCKNNSTKILTINGHTMTTFADNVLESVLKGTN